MGRDRQGIDRGACSRCDCGEYVPNSRSSTVNQRCGYCGHYPPHHWEKPSLQPDTGSDSQPPETQGTVTRVISGSWTILGTCVQNMVTLKFYIIKMLTIVIKWIFRQSLAPARFIVLIYMFIQPTRFYIQIHCESQGHSGSVSVMLQMVYIFALSLGLLFSYSLEQSPAEYYKSWLRMALLVTAIFLLLLYWVDAVYRVALFINTSSPPLEIIQTLFQPLSKILKLLNLPEFWN
ncbi:uncharacterized protein LOC134811158 [Bolinopsis microptera]|uniref:uncharacterized protein LOC134811158 n=1 Tax=Bolinopsis microptera TaxID=2820187 RepID=UPI0030796DE2